MSNVKSIFSYPLLRNTQYQGILFSLIIHLGIFAIFLSMPVTKNIPHLQTIHITFQTESGLLTTIPKHTAVESQQPERIAARKDRQVVRKQTDNIDHRQAARLAENNQTTTDEKTLSDDHQSPQESIDAEITLEKIAGDNGPSVSTQGNLVVGNVSEGNSQKGIVGSRFGDKGSPSFIYREIPVYPSLARRLGKEGKILLKLLIDANGTLQNVEVVEAAGFGFTEASIEAVKKSTYAPGYRNGEKIATRVLLPISFRLQ